MYYKNDVSRDCNVKIQIRITPNLSNMINQAGKNEPGHKRRKNRP